MPRVAPGAGSLRGADAGAPGQVPLTIVTGWRASATRLLIDEMVASLVPGRVAVVGGPGWRPQSSQVDFVETLADVSERVAGCDCCVLRSDLVRVVETLARRRCPPDWIIVQAAGLTDPVIASQTFLTHAGLTRCTRLDGIIAAIDGPATAARIVLGQPAWPDDLAADQVAMADLIVLCGVRAMTTDEAIAAALAVGRANEVAEILVDDEEPTVAGGRPALFGLEGFGPGGTSRGTTAPARFLHASRHHGPPSASTAFVLTASGRLDHDRFNAWVEAIDEGERARLLRLEGVLAFHGRDRQFLCQGIGTALSKWRGRRFGPDELIESRLAIAGRYLDPVLLHRSLAQCVAI